MILFAGCQLLSIDNKVSLNLRLLPFQKFFFLLQHKKITAISRNSAQGMFKENRMSFLSFLDAKFKLLMGPDQNPPRNTLQ